MKHCKTTHVSINTASIRCGRTNSRYSAMIGDNSGTGPLQQRRFEPWRDTSCQGQVNSIVLKQIVHSVSRCAHLEVARPPHSGGRTMLSMQIINECFEFPLRTWKACQPGWTTHREPRRNTRRGGYSRAGPLPWSR